MNMEEVWGTWEELVLGGAVVRHGGDQWHAVAMELRSRVASPSYFTPQVCKGKYEELRKRYSGNSAWYEELRKRRIADLKRELGKSNDTIGSLESKMKCLKAERGPSSQVDHGTLVRSPASLIKSEDVEYSSRETLMDGWSAGSFTQDTLINCLSECRVPAATSNSQSDMKPEISGSLKQDEGDDINKDNYKQVGASIRKRRGKRKRKDRCDKDAKEGSVAESDNLFPTNAAVSALHCKETSASECNHTLVASATNGRIRDLCRVRDGDEVMAIFISIAQKEVASVFRHRLDSQKRARYKKIIRRHLDFGILRSRIVDGSIRSVKELFRDLLLLANNALVFYSKRTREYKSAFSLRGMVMKSYRQHCEDSYNKATSSYLPFSSPLSNVPCKPRSARPRPCKDKSYLKFQCSNETDETPGDNEKLVDFVSNIPLLSLLVAKKSLKRPATVKRRLSRNYIPKPSVKEKKKVAQQTRE
ncbi:hypothetical protein LIER_10346 [Lithospermum erythrorhizon]|uniref:Bromo domain-containing protein n=1 Tax=Lithospermum erythrorhizon TaxID=34254 RepID=A0AAV3PKY4_LITER